MSTRLRSYIVVRILLLIPMLFFLILVVFVLLHVIPGDPIRTMMGPRVPEEVVQNIRHQLGLDKPIPIQFLEYFTHLLHGDLGMSLSTRRPVIVEIMYRFPATIELTVSSIIVGSMIGIINGVASSTNKNRFVRYFLRGYTVAGCSIPIFWLGLLLQIATLHSMFPLSGRIDIGISHVKITGLLVLDSILTANAKALTSSIAHLILPSLTLGVLLSAQLSRVTAVNINNTLHEDYILTARLKGLKERTVIWVHALRNALLPVVTVIGMQFAALLSGAVITETVFSIPGIGLLLVSAVHSRDYPLIQGCIIFFGLIVTVINTVVDISYAYLDPRVRY